MNKSFLFTQFIYIFLFLIHGALSSKISNVSCDNISKNNFILKTNLTQEELEQIFSKNFSPSKHNKSPYKKQKRNNNINNNVKEFKSKDDLNQSILLLEVRNNITELFNEKEKYKEGLYELIDTKENNDTKTVLLSFDKFFYSQYKEMFEYSYTIVIFILIFIIIIIYYAFILPNEAPDWNINTRVTNNNPRNQILENEYMLKENDINE